MGVERSEFMHMHFVPHSCLNLEPLGDQLQPYLKRGEGGWLAMEVSCGVGTVTVVNGSAFYLVFKLCGVYLNFSNSALSWKMKATISKKLYQARNL